MHKKTNGDGRSSVEVADLQRLFGLLVADAQVPDKNPIITVALSPHGPVERSGTVVDGVPAVIVGVSPAAFDSPPPYDVLLTDEPDPPAPWIGCPAGTDVTLSELAACVRDRPMASTVFAQLLRLGPGLSTSDLLLVESFAYSTLQAGPEFRSWLESRSPRRRKIPSGPPVLVTREGTALMITLNRPEVRNAFDTTMRDELIGALGVAIADPTIATVTIRGAGSNFCSGGDLEEFGSSPNPAEAHLIRIARSPGRWIDACSDRCTIEVHGSSVGAGVELAAFASRVRASPDATFALPEIHMGLVPGAGGTVSVPRRIGRQRTAYLGLAGCTIDAVTALHWGLVDKIDH
jgi:hypothetical protein